MCLFVDDVRTVVDISLLTMSQLLILYMFVVDVRTVVDVVFVNHAYGTQGK